MLAIEVEFLHGTYRAASAEDLALAGTEVGSPEWPPSPARLYSALVAGGGTGEHSLDALPGDSAGLGLLEGEIPFIYAAGKAHRADIGLERRYVVVDEKDGGWVQNYPARKSQEVRPGARISLARPIVRFEWPDLEPTDEELADLRLRCARIGYLGCSDSPVRVTVTTEPAAVVESKWRPDPTGDVFLPTPWEGFLEALDTAFEQWTGGAPARRSWIPNTLVTYADPDSAPDEAGTGHQGLWIRFERPVSYRLVRVVAEALRAAVLQHLDDFVGGPEAVPAVIHGHGDLDDHAYWVPLPWVGAPHADGRIMGACVLLPAHTSDATLAAVREAVARVTTLARGSVFTTGATLFDGSRRPWSAHPARWRGPARRWASAFPVVHERFTGGSLQPEEFRRWCRFAGLPDSVDVVAVRSTGVPLVPGAQRLTAEQVRRRAGDHRPFSHIEVVFDAPVRGPLLIGSMRHFGLGLMVPVEGS